MMLATMVDAHGSDVLQFRISEIPELPLWKVEAKRVIEGRIASTNYCHGSPSEALYIAASALGATSDRIIIEE